VVDPESSATLKGKAICEASRWAMFLAISLWGRTEHPGGVSSEVSIIQGRGAKVKYGPNLRLTAGFCPLDGIHGTNIVTVSAVSANCLVDDVEWIAECDGTHGADGLAGAASDAIFCAVMSSHYSSPLFFGFLRLFEQIFCREYAEISCHDCLFEPVWPIRI
jgi:hypothetical protein